MTRFFGFEGLTTSLPAALRRGIRPAILVGVVLIAPLLTHCAPTDQVNMLERRVNDLANQNQVMSDRVTNLEQQVSSPGASGVESLRGEQADLANRVEEIKGEILRINGQIEQMNHQQDEKQKETDQFRADLQTKLSQLQDEMKLLQASAKTTQEVEEARKKVAEEGVDLYQKALDLIKDKQYQDAKKALQDYIDKHPQGDRVPNAYFWLGDCEYNLQRYEEAILEYQKVISKFPSSNKVPDALLKQGLAFAKLGDKESAKIVLNKLLKSYPKSPQAEIAKKQLSSL